MKRLPLAINLMTKNPDDFLEELTEAGSDSFLVHWEGNTSLHRTVARIRALGKGVGVAINPATPSAVLEEIVQDLNQVLVMNVDPGSGHQQFEVARQILAKDLVPIIEPEVDIHGPDKAKAEDLLKAAILEKLDGLSADQLVMLKITLPEKDDLYADLVKHPRVVRVVALSGGYSREEGNRRLRRNHGVVASFSRALVEGLSVTQSDAQYNALLDGAIQSIFEASNT